MSLILSPDELVQITNGLTQAAAQLKELHRQGFVKACRPRMGGVVLYRVHYEAVATARESDERAQNTRPGPNVVGLERWASKRKQHGTQTQGL